MLSIEFPVARTPKGGWKDKMQPPILASRREPLASGVVNMRGLWRAYALEVDGQPLDDVSHVERIEQCGNRVVITVLRLRQPARPSRHRGTAP